MFGTIPLYFVIIILVAVAVACVLIGFGSCWLCKQCYLCYERKKEARQRRRRRERRRPRHYDYDDDDDEEFDDDIYFPQQNITGNQRKHKSGNHRNAVGRTSPIGDGGEDFPSRNNDKHHIEDERIPTRSKTRQADDDKNVLNADRPTHVRQHSPEHKENDEKKGCALFCAYCCCCCDSLDDEYYYDSDDEESEYDENTDERGTSAKSIRVVAAANHNLSNSDTNISSVTKRHTLDDNRKPQVQSSKTTKGKELKENETKAQKKIEKAKKKEKEKTREEKSNAGTPCCAGCCIPSGSSYEEDSDSEENEIDDVDDDYKGNRRSPNKMDSKNGIPAISAVKQKGEKPAKGRPKSNKIIGKNQKNNKEKSTVSDTGNRPVVCCCFGYESDDEFYYDSDDEYSEDECDDSDSLETPSNAGASTIVGCKTTDKPGNTPKTRTGVSKRPQPGKKNTSRKSRDNKRCKSCFLCKIKCVGCQACCKKKQQEKEDSYDDSDEYDSDDDSDEEGDDRASDGYQQNASKASVPKQKSISSISCACGGGSASDEYDNSDDYYTDEDEYHDEGDITTGGISVIATETATGSTTKARASHSKSKRSKTNTKSDKKSNKVKKKMVCCFVIKRSEIKHTPKKTPKKKKKMKNNNTNQQKIESAHKQNENIKVTEKQTTMPSVLVVAPIHKTSEQTKQGRKDIQTKNKPESSDDRITNDTKSDNSISKEQTNHNQASPANKSVTEKNPMIKSAAVASFMEEKYGSPKRKVFFAEDFKQGSGEKNVELSDQEIDGSNKNAKSPEPVLLTQKTAEKRSAAISALFASSNNRTDTNMNEIKDSASKGNIHNKDQHQNDKNVRYNDAVNEVPSATEKTREEREAEQKENKKEKNLAVMALLSGSMFKKKSNPSSKSNQTSNSVGQPVNEQNSKNTAPKRQVSGMDSIAKVAASSNALSDIHRNNNTRGVDNQPYREIRPQNANQDISNSVHQDKRENTNQNSTAAVNGKPPPAAGITARGRKDWKAAAALAVAREHTIPNMKTDWDVMGGNSNKKLGNDNHKTSTFAASVSAVMAGQHFLKARTARKNEPSWDLFKGKPKDMQSEDIVPATGMRKSKSMGTLFEQDNDLFSVELPTKRRKKRSEDFDWDSFSSGASERGSSHPPRFNQPSILMDDSHPVTNTMLQGASFRRTSLTNIRR